MKTWRLDNHQVLALYDWYTSIDFSKISNNEDKFRCYCEAVDFFESVLSMGMGGEKYVSDPNKDYPQKVIGAGNMSYAQFVNITEVNQEMKKIYDKVKNRFDVNQEKLISSGVIKNSEKISLKEYGSEALSRKTLHSYNFTCLMLGEPGRIRNVGLTITARCRASEVVSRFYNRFVRRILI